VLADDADLVGTRRHLPIDLIDLGFHLDLQHDAKLFLFGDGLTRRELGGPLLAHERGLFALLRGRFVRGLVFDSHRTFSR
jgi:hypothetical protein